MAIFIDDGSYVTIDNISYKKSMVTSITSDVTNTWVSVYFNNSFSVVLMFDKHKDDNSVNDYVDFVELIKDIFYISTTNSGGTEIDISTLAKEVKQNTIISNQNIIISKLNELLINTNEDSNVIKDEEITTEKIYLANTYKYIEIYVIDNSEAVLQVGIDTPVNYGSIYGVSGRIFKNNGGIKTDIKVTPTLNSKVRVSYKTI